MKKLTIKDLPKHGRPREKLKEKGVGALTDQELVIAICPCFFVGDAV